MKSLEFIKPTLGTTLAIVLASLLSVRPAQAGYTVTLQQVGPDVVATGSGRIDLRGLTFFESTSLNPGIFPNGAGRLGNIRFFASIRTGPLSSSVDTYHAYRGASGPTSFGTFSARSASSGSGDMVGIGVHDSLLDDFEVRLSVPKGYVSDTFLSDSATYPGTIVGITPGTYVWKWGSGKNQRFALQIEPGIGGLVTTNISNFSTRASVQTGPEVTIAGFIITGPDPKLIVVRGLGPTLAQPPFNVQGVLADPTLSLFDGSGNVLWTNDNWQDTQPGDIRSTGLAPSNDREAAIALTLEPGNYTAVLSGKNGTTGVGLVEVYDTTNTGTSFHLTNASTRGFVGTGDNVLIGGFIVSGGNGSTQVVVRGLGPTLAQPPFNVPGVLADPLLSLFDSNGNVIQSNNNWRDAQQAEISAAGIAPPNDLEAAILAPVSAGNYTAILSGNGGRTGIGLLEVYKLP